MSAALLAASPQVTAVPDASKGERLIVFHLPTDRDPREIVDRLRRDQRVVQGKVRWDEGRVGE